MYAIFCKICSRVTKMIFGIYFFFASATLQLVEALSTIHEGSVFELQSIVVLLYYMIQDVHAHGLNIYIILLRKIIFSTFEYNTTYMRALGQILSIMHTRSALHLIYEGLPSRDINLISIKLYRY